MEFNKFFSYNFNCWIKPGFGCILDLKHEYSKLSKYYLFSFTKLKAFWKDIFCEYIK